MAMEYVQSAMVSAPSGASGNSVVTGNPAWTNGSWVEFIASTGSAIVVLGIQFVTVVITTSWQNEVDIGVGAAGAESVVTTIRLYTNTYYQGSPMQVFMLSVPLDNIAQGSRVSIRARGNRAAYTFSTALIYYAKPVSGSFKATANPMLPLPSGAAAPTVSASGVAWNNTAWTQITASTAAEYLLATFVCLAAYNTYCEFDIGVGNAGAEVVVATVKNRDVTSYVALGYDALRPLYSKISAGSRVAFRARSGVTAGTHYGGINVIATSGF